MNTKQFHQEKDNSLVDVCNEGIYKGDKRANYQVSSTKFRN